MSDAPSHAGTVFLQGREHRLRDRFRFTRGVDTWRVERLWP